MEERRLIDQLIGHALNRPSQLQLYGGAPESGAWAPTLRHYNGTFYLLTTVRRVYTSGESLPVVRPAEKR